MMSEEQQNEENQLKRVECSTNFSLRWLNTAEIINFAPEGTYTNKFLITRKKLKTIGLLQGF